MDGVSVIAPQECLAVYASLNPKSLVKANKTMLVELAKRIADGDNNFNPVSMATTEVHKAAGRKFFVDFDYDEANPIDYLPKIQETLPKDSYKILVTRGGFHLVVLLEKVKPLKFNWYGVLSALPKCDVRSAGLTPVPGCTQGNFVPHFMELP